MSTLVRLLLFTAVLDSIVGCERQRADTERPSGRSRSPSAQSTSSGTPTAGTPAASAVHAASASAASPASSHPGVPLDADAPVVDTDAGQPRFASEVLRKGARVIVVDGGTVVARRPEGQAPALPLARAPRDGKLSATVAPFLGRADLLDVTIVESAEQGWHHHRTETHYVIDTSGPKDALACVFAGAASSGGEYSSTSTTIAIKATGRHPLAFDVKRITTSRASQPQPPPPATTNTVVDHFELGASSCTKAAPPP